VGDEVIGKIRYIRRGRARLGVRQLDLMCGLGLGQGRSIAPLEAGLYITAAQQRVQGQQRREIQTSWRP
jgi:hypothetical protein